ncbi:MAG: hypothetical protein ABJP45_05425 [Cyclobacteriaceae bacterium]
MSNIPENQIGDWLKKLERESWQLELLVSAFTIFLLMIAIESFEGFILSIQYQYDLSDNFLTFIFIFLFLLQKSLVALTICLVGHLMLRGFWVGTIGLRSVQSSIDFSQLNYNDFFTEKLKKKVISLDQLVIKLDEICSVIFAFAFLVMSMLLAFGMFLLSFGVLAIVLSTLGEITPDSWDNVVGVVAAFIFFTTLIMGLMYMIDYFTLGFFKKVKWLRKIYYPFYRFYNVITLAVLSRSIYYYMISKFTKKKIRTVYGLVGAIIVVMVLFDFDQHQYFPSAETDRLISINYYDDLRKEHEYIDRASIASQYLDEPHFQLFLRYTPKDNSIAAEHCPDFVPVKDEGINWSLSLNTEGGNFTINDQDHAGEDFDQLLSCLSAIYEVSVNDSVYQELSYYYYKHPDKDQKGLLTVIPTSEFRDGENLLRIRKIRVIDRDSVKTGYQSFARIPFWYKK